ncbi:MAG: hypothetical protein K1X67_19125 [Fimbriimonadaceae bacterium]|nr:hypothetical protein [Fimbriimonadaceae bacterium]
MKPGLFDNLQWRCIGPFRGGRTVGACGIADQPFTFYMGVNNGGVWKTTDAGRTWKPIFDDQPTGSIGDVMVAPSNPDVIYVGSGEGLQRPDLSTGDGMYRSTDGGKTWSHLGLKGVQQIGGICVDPRDPDRVFVAALGHPYGPNDQRGVYRTSDGGKSWQGVLFKDVDTGAIQVTVDPSDSKVVYAALWEARQGPWENGRWQGPGSGLFKSSDGGDTWTQLTSGLPTFAQGLGRIGFAIAPSKTAVLYATVDAREESGLYRSDDAGLTWRKVNSERRLVSRGDDFAEVKVDPKNPEVVYVADTSFYRSEDGGKSFVCLKGSPGGDDYHRIWINPNNPQIIMTAADQGAAISLNGGETWSSWYNQSTAQMYHVATDSEFPYSVYGGQQESGSAMVSSRGNDGQITFREWHPAGGDEYAYLAPDPLDSRYVFGGRVNRYDKVTGLVEDRRPKQPHRTLRTAPLLFSRKDPQALYYAGNVLFVTRNGGLSWKVISPDLSRETWDIPESVGKFNSTELKTMPRRGVIYTVAPSPLDTDVIWCGTDDGLIWITLDGGKKWTNVTPPGITSWSKISLMDAGHFQKGTAYAAVNRIRCDDQAPYIYRTHDFGKTWKRIVEDLPEGPINVVREDPKKPGLLFCGSEQAVYVSMDDGGSWQSLRNNMPATSIRDLVIHENDLVVATHGRGFWIMDNFAMLREWGRTEGEARRPNGVANSGPMNVLFTIQPAYRLERNTNTDTPLPPDEPAAKNPPDGALIDYFLASEMKTVTIEILDGQGKVLRKFSSRDAVPNIPPEALTVLPGWVRPATRPSTAAGPQRFVWDLRPSPPPTTGGRGQFGLPISAIWGDTPIGPQAEMVPPGRYNVRVRLESAASSEKETVLEAILEVKRDPRLAP